MEVFVKSIASVLTDQRLIRSLGHDHAVLTQIKCDWDALLGKLSIHFTPLYCYKNQLVVACLNPIWATEIRYFTPLILSKLQLINPSITGIKLTHQLLSSHPSVVPHSSLGLSLQSQISDTIQSKLAKGFNWCQRCHDVLTDTGTCTFCRCEGDINS